MALSNITFVKGSGGLARRSQSEDGITGIVFYQTVPDAFSSEPVKQIFSLSEAEALGITAVDEPVAHYHISEFYRINPAGSLFLGFYAAPSSGETPTHDFAEVATTQRAADGRIRQMGIYTQLAFSTAQVTALQAVCDTLAAEETPLSAVLCADISGLTLSELSSLKESQAPNVSVVIGQDAGGKGAELFDNADKTIGILGAVMGAISRASVHEDLAWVAKFPIGGSELDVIGFGEGTAYKSLTKTQLNELDNKGYIFCQKHVGLSGSFLNGSWTASTGDYDTIQKNRTINKAIREVRAALLPTLNQPVYVSADGALQETDVQTFQAIAARPLLTMEALGELSASSVFVDPDQSILSADELQITVQLVPVGVARFITVKIGFSLSITQ